MAAMSLKGHVVLQFNVHRDGSISDLAIVQPSPVDAFNNAAVNAIRGSSPTQPLPPEYPTDKVLFTVTFYYNESPGRSSAALVIVASLPTATQQRGLWLFLTLLIVYVFIRVWQVSDR